MRHSPLLAATLLLTVTTTRAAEILAPTLTLSPQASTRPADIETGPIHSTPTSEYGMTGDWWGARKSLEEKGICFGGWIIFDVGKTLSGGLDTEIWPIAYLLDLHVAWDPEPLLGWKGATFLLDFQSHDQSENADPAVGDLQGFDNISAPRFVQIYQLWYKQAFGDVARLKIGKIDANIDAACHTDGVANDAFSLIEHGLDFINSSAAYTPTMYPMATYPDPPPGVELFITPGGAEGGLYFGAGAFYGNRNQNYLVFTGNPESVELSTGGSFFITEFGSRWESSYHDMKLPGHAAVGGWYHTGDFQKLDDGTTVTGAGGAYAFFDQTLWQDDTRQVGAFLLAGLATDTMPIDQNLAFGITAAGFFPGRPDDSVGLFTSWGHIPSQPTVTHTFEWATEAYYKIQLTPWAVIKPDLQYIINPGGSLPDALVATLRFELDF